MSVSNGSEGGGRVGVQRAPVSGTTAVLIALAVILPCVLVSFWNPTAAAVMVMAAVVGTSLWVAADSSRLKIREYKSQVAAHPFVLFSASLALWAVVFPVYLVVRSRIQTGQLPKAPNPRERYALYACIAMWCIPIGLVLIGYFVAHGWLRVQQ